jgi:hypothetical protein
VLRRAVAFLFSHISCEERRLRKVDNILSFVSDVGFPIVVTLYLLHRIETKLDTLNDSIVTLPERLKEVK